MAFSDKCNITLSGISLGKDFPSGTTLVTDIVSHNGRDLVIDPQGMLRYASQESAYFDGSLRRADLYGMFWARKDGDDRRVCLIFVAAGVLIGYIKHGKKGYKLRKVKADGLCVTTQSYAPICVKTKPTNEQSTP